MVEQIEYESGKRPLAIVIEDVKATLPDQTGQRRTKLYAAHVNEVRDPFNPGGEKSYTISVGAESHETHGVHITGAKAGGTIQHEISGQELYARDSCAAEKLAEGMDKVFPNAEKIWLAEIKG